MHCALCHAPASVVNGVVMRTCEHATAAVLAPLVATVYGQSKVN